MLVTYRILYAFCFLIITTISRNKQYKYNFFLCITCDNTLWCIRTLYINECY